jgi:hypothetical protein
MKRLLAHILLFFVLLGPQTLHQLGKLPFLLQHFSEHRSHNEALGFWAFVALHYTAGIPNHDAHDEQLPFKKMNVNVLSFVFTAPVPFRLSPSLPTLAPHPPSVAHAGAIFLPIIGTSGSIWQPPRAAATV